MNRYRSAADTVGYDAIRLLNALRNLQPSMSATRGAWWHAKLPESPQVSKLLLLRAQPMSYRQQGEQCASTPSPDPTEHQKDCPCDEGTGHTERSFGIP